MKQSSEQMLRTLHNESCKSIWIASLYIVDITFPSKKEKLRAFEKRTFQGIAVAIVGNNNRDRVSSLQVY